ncbi:MAG TPA: hypothetical protein VI318_20375 [Baekduia sp.]
MGLLDDAIREHLELKRRRGADPNEIAREETEALGPVRREAPGEVAEAEAPEPSPYADHEPAGLDEPGAAYDDEPYEPYEPPATHDAPYPEDEDDSATPPHGDPLAHQQQTREFSATELGEALGHQDAPARDSGKGDDDARKGDDDPDADPDAEDELEDTPDFLQETPEHDRLWFEQKPPKDFDF